MFSVFHSAFASTLQGRDGSQVLIFPSLDTTMAINYFGSFGLVWSGLHFVTD